MKAQKFVLALVLVIIMLVSNRQYVAQSSDRPIGRADIYWIDTKVIEELRPKD